MLTKQKTDIMKLLRDSYDERLKYIKETRLEFARQNVKS